MAGFSRSFAESPNPVHRLASAITGGDTIVALATPPGRGALAIVRISGLAAHDIARRVVSPWPSAARQATLCTIHSVDRIEIMDHALVTIHEGTRSYTGEPTVEITTHGGALVPATVVAAFIELGARQALPGEFTRRAVLNGKLDILQAEGIADLIDARSRSMQRSALRQMRGSLSRYVAELREALLGLEAMLAYEIDFPEEDSAPVAADEVAARVASIAGMLDRLLATATTGEIIREGAVVVLAGAPNVGKSSLFNALVGRDRAIVTPIAGTTRDALEAVVEGMRWPLRLVDTAGLRATNDVIERMGVEVSERYLREADVVLACGDGSGPLTVVMEWARSTTPARVIAVRTKSDLAAAQEFLESEGCSRGKDAFPMRIIPVSAMTGEGLASLVHEVDRVLSETHVEPDADTPVLTRARHVTALNHARGELHAFMKAWKGEQLPLPIAAVHVRVAATALEELIGSVDVDDVLDRVFASFCVGK